MAVKALAKVQKKIIRKKKAKASALHEDSRDSRALHRAELRETRIARVVSVRDKQNQQLYTRVAAFAAAARHRDADDPFLIDEVQELISSFIDRSKSELEALVSARRPGRPPTARQLHLQDLMDRERKEYVSGMWVPDMLDPVNVRYLADWAGEWQSLGHIKFVRVEPSGAVKPSSFPPNGRS